MLNISNCPELSEIKTEEIRDEEINVTEGINVIILRRQQSKAKQTSKTKNHYHDSLSVYMRNDSLVIFSYYRWKYFSPKEVM